MFKFFKKLKCKHTYIHIRDIHGDELNLPHTKDVGHSYTTFVCVGLFRALPIPELKLSARLANLLVDNTR